MKKRSWKRTIIAVWLLFLLVFENIGSDTNVEAIYARQNRDRSETYALQVKPLNYVSGDAVTGSAVTSPPAVQPVPTPSEDIGPNNNPTKDPMPQATSKATAKPTTKPTAKPTTKPTTKPTAKPTAKPTTKPTAKPSGKPTMPATAKPTVKPDSEPTRQPTVTIPPISGGDASSILPDRTVVPTHTEAPGKVQEVSDTDGVCKIVYIVNQGKGNQNPTTIQKQTGVVTLKGLRRTGYTFCGWYTSMNYRTRVKELKNITKDSIVLYAKWKKIRIEQSKIRSVYKLENGTIRVRIRKLSGVTGYEFHYVPTRTSTYIRKVITKKNVAQKRLTRGIEKEYSYFVKVRAYRYDSTGKRIWGDYSQVKLCK